jgi:hypothetical protein
MVEKLTIRKSGVQAKNLNLSSPILSAFHGIESIGRRKITQNTI